MEDIEAISEIKTDNELKLIILMISKIDQPIASEAKELLRKVNWETFISLAIRHDCIPIVYRELKLFMPEIIPVDILKKIKDLYLQIVHWNFVQSNQLVQVLSILEKNEVPAIPIKGPTLSKQVYGDIGYRMFQDLDLIVESKNFSELYNVLAENGYTPSSDLTEKKKKIWTRYRRDIVFSNSSTMIDVHQRISQAHSAFDVKKEHFKEGRLLEILNQKILALSVEDALISIIINSTKDQWSKLRMIADLLYLIYSNPELKWDILFKRAKKMGIYKMLLTGICLMSLITGFSLPDFVSSRMLEDRKIGKFSQNYKNQLLRGSSRNEIPDRVRSISRTLDSGYHKFRYLVYFLFTPTPEDMKWISFPEFLFFLYRIVRPIRLGFKAFRNKKQ